MVGIEMTSLYCRWFSNWLSSIWNPSKFCRRVILILKPFKLDFIDAQGYTGTVITIFSTMLNTPDKKLVIIPNGPLYGRTY
jgi:hypothetical protein